MLDKKTVKEVISPDQISAFSIFSEDEDDGEETEEYDENPEEDDDETQEDEEETEEDEYVKPVGLLLT